MKPIFISGLYRSGTKVLTKLLEQNKQIKTTYDTIHFLRFSYNKYQPIVENYHQLVRDTRKRINDRWNMDFSIENVFSSIENGTITQASVYDSIMSEFLNISDEERWAEKTNVEWESIISFLSMFPEGKAIHIYRDPRAVLASYKYMTNQTGLKYLDAVFASLAMFNFIQKDSIQKNERIMLVKYEDFVRNPEKISLDICNFLDIEYKNEMLDVSSYKDKFGNKLDTDSSFTEQKNKIEPSSVDLWKNKLTDIEIYFSEMILKEQLKSFGYALEGIDLSREDFNKLYDLLHDEFIYKRYQYWLKYADGEQAYPNTEGAYEMFKKENKC